MVFHVEFDNNLTANVIILSPIRYTVHAVSLTMEQTVPLSLQVFDLILKDFNTLFIPPYVRSIQTLKKEADCFRVHLNKPLHKEHAVDLKA